MSTFSDAITNLIVAVASPTPSPQEVNESARAVGRALHTTTREDLDAGLERLADALGSSSTLYAAGLAMCCGAIVEAGGDPLLVVNAALDRLPEVLRGADEFVSACQEAAEAAESSGEQEESDPIKRFGSEVARSYPEEADAYYALRPLSLGTIAMLSRSREARLRSRNRGDLLDLSRSLDSASGGGSSFLTKMLCVLDDEPLLVLHPAEGKGYRLRMSGIGTNFELFILLADALIGEPAEGWLPGTRPDAAVVASCRDQPAEVARGKHAVGAWNFFNWQGLLPDWTLPTGKQSAGSDHWIWMEGVPSDIRPFEGLRVILLGPPPYARVIQGGRCFRDMRPELSVEAQLTDAEVPQWLARLAAATGRV